LFFNAHSPGSSPAATNLDFSFSSDSISLRYSLASLKSLFFLKKINVLFFVDVLFSSPVDDSRFDLEFSSACGEVGHFERESRGQRAVMELNVEDQPDEAKRSST